MSIWGGYSKDTHIWKYFKNYMKHMFPKIGSRCNFIKQSANLWHIKQLIQQVLVLKYLQYEKTYIVDGFPVPVCHYARASRCKNFKEGRPKWFLKYLRAKRKIVETVISQLSRTFNIQSIRVRDMWHLTNRFTRKVLAHNICTLINLKNGFNILDIESLVN